MGKFMNYKIATQLFEIDTLFQGHLSGMAGINRILDWVGFRLVFKYVCVWNEW